MPFKKGYGGDGTTVIYEDASGKRHVFRGGTRAWRNNNPGNIRAGKFAERHGAIGEAGGFAVFPDAKTGKTALKELLGTQGYTKGTLGDAVRRYAPKNENDTENYLGFVERSTGAKADTAMTSLTPEQKGKLADAIQQMEGYQEGKVEAQEVNSIDKMDTSNYREDEDPALVGDSLEDYGGSDVSGGAGEKRLGGGSGSDDLSGPPADPMDRDVKTWSPMDVRSVMEHPDYQKGEEAPTGKARFDKVKAYYELDDADRRPLVADERIGSKDGPEMATFTKTLFARDDEAEEIALKPVSTWTEAEQAKVGTKVFELPQGDPRQEALDGLRSKWFRHVYGDGKAEFDEFGRMKEPQPKRPIPRESQTARMPDGNPLTDGLTRVARMVRDRSQGGGVAPAVKTLQSGLNLVADARKEEKPLDTFGQQRREQEKARRDRMALATRASQPLKEDGAFGPKTRLGLKRALVDHGPGKVEEGFALGAFRDFARKNDHGGLASEMNRTLGSLFRNPSRPLPPTAPRAESGALQQTLNDLGAKTFGSGWEPLKEDGLIGPKTTSAFSQVAKGAGVDNLVRSFGSFLGFL